MRTGGAGPDVELLRVLNQGAQRVLSNEARPYDVGIALMGELMAPMMDGAEFAGTAYTMWGELTDGIDGPPRYARGLDEGEIEDLMRQAATEWLALDPSSENMRIYFERWHLWPESLVP